MVQSAGVERADERVRHQSARRDHTDHRQLGPPGLLEVLEGVLYAVRDADGRRMMAEGEHGPSSDAFALCVTIQMDCRLRIYSAIGALMLAQRSTGRSQRRLCRTAAESGQALVNSGEAITKAGTEARAAGTYPRLGNHASAVGRAISNPSSGSPHWRPKDSRWHFGRSERSFDRRHWQAPLQPHDWAGAPAVGTSAVTVWPSSVA